MSFETLLIDTMGAMIGVLFLPGNAVIWVLLQFSSVGKVVGVSPGMYSSLQSAIISGLVWIAAFIYAIKAFKR